MRRRHVLLIVAACVALLLLDRTAAVVVASAGELVAGLLLVAIVAAAVALVARRGLRRAGFVLVPVAVVVLLLEVVLRWWFPNTSPGVRAVLSPAAHGIGAEAGLYRPHHYALYTLTPDVATADGLRHNHRGLRDDRDLDPDPGAIRIVFIGGSTTYTIGIRDNRRIFTVRLEERLNRQFAEALHGRRLEVVNAGVPGATSAESLIRLELLVAEIEPDLVVIQHGLNDGWARAAGDLAPDYANYRHSWSPPPVLPPGRPLAAGVVDWLRRRSMMVALGVGGLRLLPVPVVADYVRFPDEHLTARNLASSSPRYFVRNTRAMIAIARSLGAAVVLATMAVAPDWSPVPCRAVAEHNAALIGLAAETGTPLFDFAAVMDTGADCMPDGRHVSQRGSDLKAELFAGYLIDSGAVAGLLTVADDPPATP